MGSGGRAQGQEAVGHHRQLGPGGGPLRVQGVCLGPLEDALPHRPLDGFTGPGRHGGAVPVSRQGGLAADVLPLGLGIAVEEHRQLLPGDGAAGGEGPLPGPLGDALLLRPAEGGGIPGPGGDVGKPRRAGHRRGPSHAVEQGHHFLPEGGAVRGKPMGRHPLKELFLVQVQHRRAIPGLGAHVGEGLADLFHENPLGEPVQVYVAGDAGDPAVVLILEPHPGPPGTDGFRLLGAVVGDPQGVAGQALLPDGGGAVGVGIKHRGDPRAGLQGLGKGQGDGVELGMGEAPILLKVHCRAAVVGDLSQELCEIGRLLPGLGGILGGHVEIEPRLQPGFPGFGGVLPEAGVLRVAIARPDIDHRFPGGLHLGKVDLPLPDAHIQPLVGGRLGPCGEDGQGQEEQQGANTCHPVSFHCIHHNFLWDRSILCPAQGFGEKKVEQQQTGGSLEHCRRCFLTAG